MGDYYKGMVVLSFNNSFIFLAFILVFKFINCTELHDILYENLTKFNAKSLPFPVSNIPLLYSDLPKPKLPLDTYMEICDYLSFNDLIVFSETCKDSYTAIKRWSANRLVRINPYYVFNQNWVNMMIYKMINDKKFNQDDLDFISFNFIINHQQLNTNKLIILRFLYQTVYGLDALVPLNQKDWRIAFLRHVQSFDMPKTKAFINEYYFNHPGLLECEADVWIELIDFFSSKPSLIDQAHFRNSFDQHQHSQNHYTSYLSIPDEFEIIFQENLRIKGDKV